MYGNASKIAVNATCGNNFSKIGLPHVYIALFRCLWVRGGGLEPFRRVLRSDGSQPSERKTRFVACAVEMNLAWNFTERERLTLYYNSAEELGRLALLLVFFWLRGGVSPGWSVQPLLFLMRGNTKNDNSLKRLRIALKSERTIEKTTRH